MLENIYMGAWAKNILQLGGGVGAMYNGKMVNEP